MIDIATGYALALVPLLSLGLGLLVGRRMRPRPPEPLRAICSCEHGYGSHADGKACQVSDKVADHWDVYGRADHWIPDRCPCLRYDGPDPAIFGMDVA
jgi:hypothetical protein